MIKLKTSDGLSFEVPTTPELSESLVKEFGGKEFSISDDDIPRLQQYPSLTTKELSKAVRWSGKCSVSIE